MGIIYLDQAPLGLLVKMRSVAFIMLYKELPDGVMMS